VDIGKLFSSPLNLQFWDGLMIQVYTQDVNGIWLGLACVDQQVIATAFAETEQKSLGNLLVNLPFNMPFQVLVSPSAFAKGIFALMEKVFAGKDVDLSLNLATSKLPEYTNRVLRAVMQIPVGYVATYGGVAKAVGGGPRAVGNIMAGNVFAPIVPCHRVVKSDFCLGGYGGGLKVKYQLLSKEKRGYSEQKCVSLEGGVLEVYPVEFTLKAVGDFL
jgi:O-6-methylguanine DNA methyltransferase